MAAAKRAAAVATTATAAGVAAASRRRGWREVMETVAMETDGWGEARKRPIG